ncbi:MAG: SsrA-binding protein SmpB, partial [Deltaproteobacteria bacterium]|nr:SsrA-binding protein SmpB [Deltaproteobacteria bacterium]
CENRRARHEYSILDTMEAGVALAGSEVKSLRAGGASLAEAYVRFEDGEAWLVDAHIAAYEPASSQNHDPRRRRKLLLRRTEMDRWAKRARERGLTAVPLRLYFRGPWAKLEVGLGRGRKLHDKRAAMKERDDRREMDRGARGG